MSPTRRSIKKEKQVKRAAKESGGALVRGQNVVEAKVSVDKNASANAASVLKAPVDDIDESNVEFEANVSVAEEQQEMAQEITSDAENARENEEIAPQAPDTADVNQHANDNKPDVTARIRKIVIEESAECDGSVTDATSDENAPNDSGASPNETSPKNKNKLGKQGKDANQQSKGSKAKRKSVKAKAKKIIPKVIAGIIIAVLVLVVAFFVAAGINRWMRYDDAASIQGKWQIYGSDSSIQINSTDIILADDVSYEYELDEMAKTISYEFGSLSGGGHYRFSYDRNTLAIIEDGTHVWTYTAIDDLCWWFEHLSDIVQGNEVLPAEPGKTVTLLVRVQDGGTGEGETSGSAGDSDVNSDADSGASDDTDSGASDGVTNDTDGGASSDAANSSNA